MPLEPKLDLTISVTSLAAVMLFLWAFYPLFQYFLLSTKELEREMT
jgi:hypothetical protein